MRVILVDTNATLIEAWRSNLVGLKYVNVFAGSLNKIDPEMVRGTAAVISPGNSFGYLGGGFDLALRQYFGGHNFENFFKKQLCSIYKPVGTATVVKLGPWSRNGFKYIIHIPTVVAPAHRIYNADRSLETGYRLVFDAMWNALVHCPRDADTLVTSGLGTGYVGVPEAVCSKAMSFAIRLFFANDVMSPELTRVVIMQFLGYRFDAFIPAHCLDECFALGIDREALMSYNADEDPIENILPQA
ncbi:LANO_0D06436g1_1 [Lachancea nothofagi CBS 11611]|uniref:LANO_0D06436g1_1 n=1 Tax=Lachancea nothofagi CBS 11611 TaxID=1266666 RepID=A0A1G4JHB3_9SACH|nr:LANO_0D06436g1_1 [Lachancea nothofagi CBS 11611]